jgi:hypothetical protein
MLEYHTGVLLRPRFSKACFGFPVSRRVAAAVAAEGLRDTLSPCWYLPEGEYGGGEMLSRTT